MPRKPAKDRAQARAFQRRILEASPMCQGLYCVRWSAVAHHLVRSAGKRYHDEPGLALCWPCHEELHQHGEETFIRKNFFCSKRELVEALR